MLTPMSEKRIGARLRSTSRICISAQLSFPPERPTMTRSPSSIRLKSWIALVTFLATLDSRCVEYPTCVFLSRYDCAAGRYPAARDLCVSVLRDDVDHRAEEPRIAARTFPCRFARHLEEGDEPCRGGDRHVVEITRRLHLTAEWHAIGHAKRDLARFAGGQLERLRLAVGGHSYEIGSSTVP